MIGILLSSVLMLFCLSMVPMLDHFKAQVEASSFAKYQYILKMPAATKVSGAEKYCIKTMYIKGNIDEEIAVYGVSPESSYLNRKKMPTGQKEVLVSASYAAFAHNNGHAAYNAASYVYSVAALILFK